MLRSNWFSVFSLRSLTSVLVLFVAIALGGCATPRASHDVTVFHDWPASLADRSFRLADNPAAGDDLKWRTWRNIVRKELLAAGFVESANPSIEVAFEYTVSARDLRYRRRAPYFTPYFHFGGRYRRGGLSITAPFWWWGQDRYGYDTVVQVHDHELKLTMSDLRAGKANRVFEGSGVARNSAPQPTAALPLLTRAVLTDFPGISGVARRVDIEPDPAPAAKK